MVREAKLLRENYRKSGSLKWDILSIFPTDLAYLLLDTSCHERQSGALSLVQIRSDAGLSLVQIRYWALIGPDQIRFWALIGPDQIRYWALIGPDQIRYWALIGGTDCAGAITTHLKAK